MVGKDLMLFRDSYLSLVHFHTKRIDWFLNRKELGQYSKELNCVYTHCVLFATCCGTGLVETACVSKVNYNHSLCKYNLKELEVVEPDDK